jgi:hypothetical protein
VSRGRAWLVAGAALLVAATAAAAVHRRERLRHLAVPLWDDPSLPSAAPRLPVAAALPATTLTTLARLPSRVTAIVETGGVVFVATFDGGLFRYDAARPAVAPIAVGELRGRERFVDALVAWDGGVVAGTHAGAILLDASGNRRATWAAGEAVAAIAIVDDALLVGGAHGLWAGTPPIPHPLRGPDGETIRVTALAASAGRLYLGSPSGVYSVALPLRATDAGTAATVAHWHPLVFGAPAATSNVVTALTALPTGVLAGTDDGGAVLLSTAGVVRALPFAEPAANGINPGAVLSTADGTVLLGTEGGGLVRLVLDPAAGASGSARASRPAAWPHPQISAVSTSASGCLLLGAADGALLSL